MFQSVAKISRPTHSKVCNHFAEIDNEEMIKINFWFLIFRVSLSKGLDLHSALKFTKRAKFSFLLYFLFIFKGQICPSKKSLQLKLQRCKSTATNPPK